MRNRLETGVGRFHGLETLTDANKKAISILEKKEDKRSNRVMNVFWDLMKLVLAAAIGAFVVYLTGGV